MNPHAVRFCQRLDCLCSKSLCFFQAISLQHNDKFIPAQTANTRTGGSKKRQPFSDLDKKLVAAVMAQSVVDIFELIQIKQQQRQRLPGLGQCALSATLCKYPRYFRQNGGPVGKACERIKLCHPLNICCGFGLLGHIINGENLSACWRGGCLENEHPPGIGHKFQNQI